MPASQSQSLVVILGASEYPDAPTLAAGPAFLNSAIDFRNYVTSAKGFAIPKENVLWLFDDTRSPGLLLKDLRLFLERRTRELNSADNKAENLVVYYVGHGLFVAGGGGQEYCFAIGSTDQSLPGPTSIKSSDLAFVLKDSGGLLRKYLVLDCCFAASAFKDFQSAPLTAACEKLHEHLPAKGTSLLCSSNARNASLVLPDQTRTMFSDALLETLNCGDRRRGPKISIFYVGELVKDRLKEKHKHNWVRPEVHSPGQEEGEISDYPLFPNPSYSGPSTTSETKLESSELERLQMELGIAADTQQQMMAQVVSDVPFAELKVVGKQRLGLGGDLFEIVKNSNSVAFVIADVSGKGFSAAIFASVMQGMIHALLDQGSPLAETAQRLNTFACSRSLGRYATLILGRMYEDGKLELMNCGFVQPLLISDNSATPIANEGFYPIGLLPDAVFDAPSTYYLKPGDRLLLFTDGVIEASDVKDEFFGYERLKSCCLTGPESVEKAILEYAGHKPPDDDYLIAELTYRGLQA